MRKLASVLGKAVEPLSKGSRLIADLGDLGLTLSDKVSALVVGGVIGVTGIAGLIDLLVTLRGRARDERFFKMLAAHHAANLADAAAHLKAAGVPEHVLADTSNNSPIGMLAALVRHERQGTLEQGLEALGDLKLELVNQLEANFSEISRAFDFTLEDLRAVRAEVSEIATRLAGISDKLDALRPFPGLIVEAGAPSVATRDLPNPFRAQSRRVPMFGRAVEFAELQRFLYDGRRVAWWLWTGEAGMGKTRLAHELCLVARAAGWDAGFLSQADAFRDWGKMRCIKPTLLVVDYVAGRPRDVVEMIAGLCTRPPDQTATAAAAATAATAETAETAEPASEPGHHPVRVLLLERAAEGRWWEEFNKAPASNAAFEVRYAAPRRLTPLGVATEDGFVLDGDSYLAIIQDVLLDSGVALAVEPAPCLKLLLEADPHGARPLYAAIVGRAVADLHAEHGAGVFEHLAGWKREDLLRHVIEQEAARWRQLPEAVADLYTNALFAARLRGGLDLESDGAFVAPLSRAGAEGGPVLPDEVHDATTWHRIADFTGTRPPHDEAMPPLEPDLLGEFFVLERLGGGANASGRSANAVRRDARR
ncbi:MAG: hypothetical protein ACFCVE_08430, partial [Phycisphaerae bacterium]